MFRELTKLLQPSTNPILEQGLEALLPTIKELLLYSRVVDGFRKESIHFDGDNKFWELYLRETLNQLVAKEAQERFPNAHRPSLIELTAIRNEFVDHLLSLDTQGLRSYFTLLPHSEKKRHFEGTCFINSPLNIDWDYQPQNKERSQR